MFGQRTQKPLLVNYGQYEERLSKIIFAVLLNLRARMRGKSFPPKPVLKQGNQINKETFHVFLLNGDRTGEWQIISKSCKARERRS